MRQAPQVPRCAYTAWERSTSAVEVSRRRQTGLASALGPTSNHGSLLGDVHVADEAPGAHLELGTFAESHFHSLIAEEGGAPGDNPRTPLCVMLAPA